MSKNHITRAKIGAKWADKPALRDKLIAMKINHFTSFGLKVNHG